MPTSVRLAPETEERLDALAHSTGRTKAYYIRQMIENSIDDIEDYYAATEVLERVRKGEEKVYSSAYVRKELGLDN